MGTETRPRGIEGDVVASFILYLGFWKKEERFETVEG